MAVWAAWTSRGARSLFENEEGLDTSRPSFNLTLVKHDKQRPPSAAVTKTLWLKISGDQVIRSLATAPINLRCDRINQFPVRIERAEKSNLVEPHVRFNSLQRIGIDEKRCLHRAVVPPKPHGTPRCIIKTAFIWKTKRPGLARALVWRSEVRIIFAANSSCGLLNQSHTRSYVASVLRFRSSQTRVPHNDANFGIGTLEPPGVLEDQWPPSRPRKHRAIPPARRSWWPRGDRREMTILRSLLRPPRLDSLRVGRVRSTPFRSNG